MNDLVLGMMSGTSLDGVDCVLVEFRDGTDAPEPVLVRRWSGRFPVRLRRRLMECAENRATSWETARLHHDLGRFYARVAMSGWRQERLLAIGLHGQTVFHGPVPSRPATLQLGEPAYLSEALKVPVVSNFRVADLAAGGQGAPMATLFHARVFASPSEHVCVQNLGGIGNVTSLDGRRRGRRVRVQAFDTGPGNMLMDAAARRLSHGRLGMDRNGRLAERGMADSECLRRWLRHGFIHRPPPKSTGRELFGAAFFDARWREMEEAGLSAADRMATLTELTAASVALNYRLHLTSPPDRVVVCGGGAKNGFLVGRLTAALRESFPRVEVRTCAALGWPPEAIEGAAFALLAFERLKGRRGNVPESTGARRAVLCGQVTEVEVSPDSR